MVLAGFTLHCWHARHSVTHSPGLADPLLFIFLRYDESNNIHPSSVIHCISPSSSSSGGGSSRDIKSLIHLDFSSIAAAITLFWVLNNGGGDDCCDHHQNVIMKQRHFFLLFLLIFHLSLPVPVHHTLSCRQELRDQRRWM